MTAQRPSSHDAAQSSAATADPVLNAKPRHWWPAHLLLGWINMVLTAPVIYLFVGLPLVMRGHGWSGADIGLLQLAGLPAIFKFVLATPVDRWRLGRASYRNWAVVLALAYAAVLWLLACQPLGSAPNVGIFVLVIFASLSGAWADIPVNALAIALLPASQRVRAGAIRSAATSLGAIVGGGLMLVLNTHLGWAWPLLALALGVLSAMVAVVVLAPLLGRSTVTAPLAAPADVAPNAEPDSPLNTRPTAPRASLREWLSWFSCPAHRAWAVLLALHVPVIGAAWVYLKPLMLDAGFAPGRIALIVGVGGGLVAAAASMAGSSISRRHGAHRSLSLFAGLNLLALLALNGALLGDWGHLANASLLLAAMLVALGMGASAGLVFGLMMNHTRPALAALDYGIQSSIFILGRTLLPLLAGLLLDHAGHAGMLLGLAALAGVTLALALHLRAQ